MRRNALLSLTLAATLSYAAPALAVDRWDSDYAPPTLAVHLASLKAGKVDVREIGHLEQLDSRGNPQRVPTVRTVATTYLGLVAAGLEPAVSVHVYAPALVEMTTYAEDGPRLRQLSSQLIGVDW